MSVWSSTAAWTRTNTTYPASHRPLCLRGTPTPGPSYGAASAASCSDKRSLADICTLTHTRTSHAYTGCVVSLLSSLFHLFSSIYHCVTSICLLCVFYAQCGTLHVRALSPRVSFFQCRVDHRSYLICLLTAVKAAM